MTLRARQIPIAIFTIFTLIPIIGGHINIPILNEASTLVVDWASYMANFAFFLGIYASLRFHLLKIQKQEAEWYQSIVAIVAMAAMLILGFVSKPTFDWVFDTIYQPTNIALFAFVSMYYYSSMYRGYRVRNFDAAVLVLSTAAIMFLYLPAAEVWISPVLSQFGSWVSDYPSLAGLRGLMMGVGIGLIALTIRSILGYEKGFLTGGT
ncbi:hypothetical protein ACFL0D_00425 [Thermoproteota archaeon]